MITVGIINPPRRALPIAIGSLFRDPTVYINFQLTVIN